VLTDPERSSEEWSDEVWAKSLEEAQKLCQLIAGDELTEVLQVTQKTKTPNKKGSYKFICWFKTEESYDDSDSANSRN
jgi:phosphate-selective porin